jgi:hypothetical protein
MLTARRQSLKALGLALVAAGTMGAAPEEAEIPSGAHTLAALTKRLASLPRRRDFKSAPMILDHRELWDADALDAVIHYAGGPKQSWDNTDLQGPWLNTMRNAINTEVWGFKHPDFLCVSATHGPAHLALYDEATWEKYELAKIAGGNVTRNSFIGIPAAMVQDSSDFQNPNGRFFTALQQHRGLAAARRGVSGLPQRHLGAGQSAERRERKSRQIVGRCALRRPHQSSDLRRRAHARRRRHFGRAGQCRFRLRSMSNALSPDRRGPDGTPVRRGGTAGNARGQVGSDRGAISAMAKRPEQQRERSGPGVHRPAGRQHGGFPWQPYRPGAGAVCLGQLFLRAGGHGAGFRRGLSSLSRPGVLRDAAARLAAEADGRRRHRHLRQHDFHRQAGCDDGRATGQRGLGSRRPAGRAGHIVRHQRPDDHGPGRQPRAYRRASPIWRGPIWQ